MTRAELLEKCRQVGIGLRDLPSDPDKSKKLRRLADNELKDHLYNLEVDADLRHLCFFLSILIEDAFYNIAADVVFPSEHLSFLEATRTRIMQSIGQALVELTTSLENGNRKQCYESYVRAATTYLAGICDLNDRVSSRSS